MTRPRDIADVYILNSEKLREKFVTFDLTLSVGQVACHECFGTGWWGYGPTRDEDGECVDCKGTGREWVALW